MIVGMKVGVKVRVRAGKSGQISKAIGLGREDGGCSDVLSSKVRWLVQAFPCDGLAIGKTIYPFADTALLSFYCTTYRDP